MSPTRSFVLVVEDDEDIRETLVEALREEGFDAEGVEHGAAALSLLRWRSPPAVIFLDLMMPVMSGADFLAALRPDRALSAIPIVILSADASVGARASELGVAEYLRKPLKLQALTALAARYAVRAIGTQRSADE